MFTHFNQIEKSVHYPQDRKLFIGLNPYAFLIIGIVFLGIMGAAWIQFLVYGLPKDPSLALLSITEVKVKGFPLC